VPPFRQQQTAFPPAGKFQNPCTCRSLYKVARFRQVRGEPKFNSVLKSNQLVFAALVGARKACERATSCQLRRSATCHVLLPLSGDPLSFKVCNAACPGRNETGEVFLPTSQGGERLLSPS